MNKKISALLAKWQESLGLRLSIFIMGITIVLFAMTIGICVYEADEMTTESSIKNTEEQMNNALEFINNNLEGVEKTVRSYASNAKFYTNTKEGCYKLCEAMVRNDTSIIDATIMFRHDHFPDMPAGHHLFAPAVAHEAGTQIYSPSNLVADSDADFQYEETDSNWIWTNKLDAGYWCEPYQDVYHTHDFLVTYSYPLHDNDGKIYGILCADIKLKWLSDRLNEFRPTKHTLVKLITRNGHFLVHNIQQYIEPESEEALLGPSIDKAINARDVDTTVVSLYNKMMSGKPGKLIIDKPAYFTMCGKTDTIPEGFVLYSPIMTSGWAVAAVCPQSDLDEQAHTLVTRILLCALVGLILMAGALFYMVRRMVRPYKQFAAVNADIKTAERIQSSMISNVFPLEASMMGKSLFASMKPAKSIGGDLYDYHLAGDKLTFIVGDVSGKGVPAAFFMASALTLFRVFANKGMGSAEIVSEINNSLSRGNETMMFVTMFVGKLDLSTGEMKFCNGGHNAPVVVHNGKAEFIQMETNLPIGVIEEAPFIEESLTLVNNDRFLVYTDGVTEAEDLEGKLYSDERLLEFLSNHEFNSPNELCDALSADIQEHAGDAEQSDDITMMCIRF